jgi:hypothetical protein
LPGLGDPEYRRILRVMWDNLGRVFGEYPHLSRIRCFGPGALVEVVGTEHVDAVSGRPIIFFSGHFGNWEIGYLAARQYGLAVSPVYRAVNNPAVDAIMLGFRRATGVEPIAKGAAGARRIIAAMRDGRALTMLVDQKMNDGIPVKFFGRDAMTAPAGTRAEIRRGAPAGPGRTAGWRPVPGDRAAGAGSGQDRRPSRRYRRRDGAGQPADRGVGARGPGTMVLGASPLAGGLSRAGPIRMAAPPDGRRERRAAPRAPR